MEEAGARMLHLVRESINKDSSIDARLGLVDALNTYFSIMMCNQNDADDVRRLKEYLSDSSQKAKPAGAAIIEEGMSVLN